MRTADAWDPPDDSTIGAVAGRIIREQNQQYHPPIIFHFDSEAAQRGRVNAGKTATARARERKARRG